MASLQISKHFGYGALLRFTAPVAAMMLFTSVYGVVDGLFVSNFVGKEPFAALNLIYPVIMMMGAFGLMFGTGGSALVAKTLGEGDRDRACGLFSFIICAVIVSGVVCALVGLILLDPIARFLGADGELLRDCTAYGSILVCSLPLLMLQEASQSFLTAAGRPKLGFVVVVVAGLVNLVLDALFILVLGWGLPGAALATAVGEGFGGIVPLVYFLRAKGGMLHLGRPIVDWRALGKVCGNGLSELVSNVSMSLVATLYNYQLMSFIGADGVAAYGVLQYVMWIFGSVLFGFTAGISPLISYQYGARSREELQSLFKKGMSIIWCLGVLLTAAALVLAIPLAMLFVGYDATVFDLTVKALHIYSFMFLFAGYNFFASALFTALNNGVVSATVSFVRTMVFEVAAVFLLPIALGADGIWFSVIVADVLAAIVSTSFILGLRKHYGYMG